MSVDLALPDKVLMGQTAVTGELSGASARSSFDEVELTIYHDLAAAEPVWRNLQKDGACTPFQSFEWLSDWQRHIGARVDAVPCVVVARDSNGAPLFVLPLAVQPSSFARELTWLGSELCDYNAPLLAADCFERLAPATFTALWRRIVARLQADPRTRHDLIRFEKMPPTLGDRPNPMLGLATSLNPSGSYVTPLFGTWDEFYKAKRSSSTRRRDRSKRNHLAEAGEVKFVSSDNPAAALDTFAVLVEQKSRTFARHGIRNLFARPGYLDFYRDIAGNPRAREFIHVSELKVGDEIVATNLGLVFGGRYYHVLASYTDGDLSHWGPGAAHLNDLLSYAIERKLAAFDFTIGDERYKRDWCDSVQPLYDHVSVAGWRGAFVVGPALVMQRLKRAIKQTPILWATVVKARAISAALRGRAKSAAKAEVESEA